MEDYLFFKIKRFFFQKNRAENRKQLATDPRQPFAF